MTNPIISRLFYFFSDFWLYLILSIIVLIVTPIVAVLIYRTKYQLQTKKIIFSSLAIIFCIYFIFLIFEIYFRYFYDASDGLGFLKVNSKWHERHVIHNFYFFRDRDFTVDKQPNVTRIGVLGDSITFGGGIENVNDRFSNILEKKLRESGFNVEVYNLGKPGYDTEGEILEYQKVRHLNFDLIIWQYFLNDIQPLEKSTGTPIIAKESQVSVVVKFFSDRSYFFDWLFWRFSSRYQKTFSQLQSADLAQYQNTKLLARHQNAIANFIAAVKGEKKEVIIIIFPFVHLLEPNYPAKNIHTQMKSYFESLNVEVIDLKDNLQNVSPENLLASKFDPHPNELVHRIAAEKLYLTVIKYLK